MPSLQPVDHYLAPDFKSTSYWWDASPLRDDLSREALPDKADVVVIGAGYTGLCAALELARGGRKPLVLEAQQAGFGCSTRNGGQISSSIKPGYKELKAQYGDDLAAQILGEGHEALAWIGRFVKEESIDCDFRECGRFYGAHRPSVYERFPAKLADQAPGVTIDADMIPRSEQHQYIDTDSYHGGVFYRKHCSLDPGRYHAGLLQRVLDAGGEVVDHAAVEAIERNEGTQANGKFTVTVGGHGARAQKRITATEVIVATNGYSKNIVPALRKRIIPIGSYIIATEELPSDVMERLIPGNRIVTDSRNMVVYYRPSPDNKRILFGARVSITESDAVNAVPATHRELTNRFPELADTKVSHAWMGFVAYTFDSMPHLGKLSAANAGSVQHKGVHYAMGYCGSGVSLSSFSGVRLAKQILGADSVRASFSKTKFSSRFYYRQNPWFLKPSLAWYRYLDSRT